MALREACILLLILILVKYNGHLTTCLILYGLNYFFDHLKICLTHFHIM